MGLLGRMFGQSPSPTPAPSPPAPARRFAADRDRLFDIHCTATLFSLLQEPRTARDAGWTERLHDAAWYASLALPSREPFEAIDGFRYLRFDIPHPGAFEAQSVGAAAAFCIANDLGAVVFASPDAPVTEPAWVFSMGALDGMMRLDTTTGDPLDTGPPDADPDVYDKEDGARLTVRRDHQVMIGTPSRDYLPPATARALHHHLIAGWRMAEPRVMLMVDPAMQPARTLVIGRKRSEFPADVDVDAITRALLWHFPPNQMLALMPEHWTFDQLVPLAPYCGDGPAV